MKTIVKIILVQVLVLSLTQTVSAFSGAGAGTGANPYIITNVTELQEMSGGLNAWYELGNDIDASATVNWNGGQGFVPVGDSAHGFAGNFDGKGFSITGLFINRAGSDNIGLFGTARIATVKDVNLVNVNIRGNSSTGSLVGYSDTSTISDCSCSGATIQGASNVGGMVGNSNNSTITDCSCSGATVNGATCVGGMVGNKSGGTITGCSAYQPVVISTGAQCGGLLGYQISGSLINCRCYTASVSGTSDTGGLVGYSYEANIDNSVADDVTVTGSDSCGGLVGRIHVSGGNYTNSHSSGIVRGTSYVGGLVGRCDTWNSPITILSNCYSQASVTGTGDSCGGLVGRQQNSTTVTDCHATGTVTGNNYVGGLVGYAAPYWNSVTKCYATGNVRGFEQVGGLVGRNEYSSISKCYSSGSVINGNNYVGGCVGYNATQGTISRCFSTSDPNASAIDCGGFVGKSDYIITDCFATGKASGDNFVGGFAGETTNAANTSNCYSKGLVTANSNFGGFAGYNSGTSSACFWDIETSGVGVSGCGTGMTTIEMMQRDTFNPPWNFATIWGIDEGYGYPYIMELSPICGDPWHPYPNGDLNYDCRVNISDFAEFAENWLKCTAPECDVARPGAFSLTLTSECSDSSPQIRLNWTPSSGVSTYDVYRGGTLYRSDLTGTQLVDTSVSTGSNYAYFVRAKNTGGWADTPSQSETAPPSCLTPPGAFSLTLTSECSDSSPQIRLNWTTSSDASTYDVYRGGTLYQSDLTDNQFIDTSIVAGGGTGSGYTYFVQAKNSDGTTDTTPQSATAPTGCGIEPPGDFSLTLTPECNGSNPQIYLNWTTSLHASTYDVYRGGTLYDADITGTEFVDTSVSAGSSYTYFVHANNAGGTTDTTTQSATAPTGCSSGGTPPTITSVDPNPITADAANGYQTLTINGANFVNKPTIVLTWTGQSGYILPASRVTFVSDLQLSISIHLGAVADNWTVKAINPDSQSSSAFSFTAQAPVTGGTTDYPEATWIAAGAGHFTTASRGQSDVTSIVIHTTEDASYGAAIVWFQDPAGNTSAHYIVRRDGTVVQMVRESSIAHHAGTVGIPASWIWNQHSIGIEVERLANPTEEIATAQYNTVKSLVDSIRTRFDVPLVFPASTPRSSPTVVVDGIVGHGKDVVNGVDPVHWDWSYFQLLW